MTQERRYRCRFCGHRLPAWLPKRLDSAMLFHHLGRHPTEAGPYLRRMEREPIDAVLLEVFEVMEEA